MATKTFEGVEVRPPSTFLTLSEGVRTFVDAWAYGATHFCLNNAPKGDGHPILVLPGFMADDASTFVLRRFLKSRGYRVHGWGLGRNLGAHAGLSSQLRGCLENLHDRYEGQSISLVGQSLGGTFSRVLAQEHPDYVRMVITLGSPFAVWGGTAQFTEHLYERLNHQTPQEVANEMLERVSQPLPVPSTSIYSKQDGVVSWPMSLQKGGKDAENIEVVCSHIGMGLNPSVLYATAHRLAQPEGRWRPFAPSGTLRMFYPDAVPV